MSKSEKAHRYLNIVSTGFGICGAVGTFAVWAISTWYVGDLEIRPDKPLQTIVVKVYDSKGNEAQFRTPQVQLMPGSYHVEVTANGGKPQLLQAKVEYGKKQVIPIIAEAPAPPQTPVGQEDESKPKKRWWRFWR
jgi:hypothetical protein